MNKIKDNKTLHRLTFKSMLQRYILVAMLALLPNAMWGDNVFLSDVHQVSINLESIMYPNSTIAYNHALIYFLDRDGNIVTDGIKLGRWNQSGNVPSETFDGSGLKKSGNYYIYSKSQNSWGAGGSLFVFNITTESIDLSGYQVVFKASNTNDFETDKETSDVTLTYQFYSQNDIDNIAFTKSSNPALEKTAYAMVDGSKCLFSFSSILDEVKSILGVSSGDEIKDFYIRWTISNKADNSRVDNLTVSGGKVQKRDDTDYIYFNNSGNAIQTADLNVTFELPSGSSWDDVQASFVISGNLSELTSKYGIIEHEPTLAVLYHINFATLYNMPFRHYVGHANSTFDAKGYQQTAEWEYYVYVDKDAVGLNLPFDGYAGNNGDALEPKGYIRWYDYKTDRANSNLSKKDETTSVLHNIVPDGVDYGMFAYNMQSNPVSKNIGVLYTPPTDAASADWVGEDIACDVSRYLDGMDDSRTYLLHEPTLSIRYIYHIRSAASLADEIMNTVLGNNPSKPSDRTYEDGKKLSVGLMDKSSILTLRLNLTDYTNYYYHPLAAGVYKQNGGISGFTHQVYYADEANKLVVSDFDATKLCKATKIEWWAYDKDKQYCLNLGSLTSRFFDLTMDKLNNNWMPVSMSGDVKKFEFKYGDPVYIVAFAMDDDGNRCPIANFDVRFMNTHPMTKDEIAEKGLNNRLISYLDEHYDKATKPITFDDDDDEQTLAAPTTPDNNQDRLPSKWDRRSYGFVYRDLIDYTASAGRDDEYNNPRHSPLHGEYGIYKSANVKNISERSTTIGYVWYQSGDKNVLYDKTYETTNGSQYGHFLYVDASDESRNIAASEFSANLCTGQQLIFTAAVADMTDKDIKPQLMFKLYGVDYDADGKIANKQLVHSFSSGDFAKNVEGTLQEATWYQVYGKVILQKESGVERFSNFRLEIDNYCKGTLGADYAVDDIRMYVEPAKVQVLQDKPICNEENQGAIKLKIRAIHETLNAITGHENTKIYFRFVDEDGNLVTGKDYYVTEQTNKTTNKVTTIKNDNYATVDVFDSESDCYNYLIDGVSMIEADGEGERYIVISNRHYALQAGKKYYVSVCTEDPTKEGAVWGNPADVCSVYSDWFEMLKQQAVLTDLKGNTITNIRVSCTGETAVTVNANLVTVDQQTGGKITLSNVKFDWYLDEGGSANLIAENTNQLKNFTKFEAGKTYKIILQPVGSQITDENSDGYGYIEYKEGGKTYWLCPGTVEIPLRVSKDGPQLNFGFNDVAYPFNDGEYEASLRIGLPQIKALKGKGGYLQIPLHSASYIGSDVTEAPLTFVNDNSGVAETSADVFVADSNDPLFTDEQKLVKVGTLRSSQLDAVKSSIQSTLDLAFADDIVNLADESKNRFHEGYWYELRFVFEQRASDGATTNCPGEAYLKLKIVPEYVTWRPTANGGMNANWNNDANWHRSSSDELYKSDYTEYNSYIDNSTNAQVNNAVDIATIDNYVPMKFTKVTIAELKGLPFPDLGNIVYRTTNQIATKLTNGKGNEATKYIQYDIMAYWDEADDNKGLGKKADYVNMTMADGDMSCEKYYGNTCHQIYFKPQGELRDQCYLVYDKAWVEKELMPNTWYTMATPLQYIYAGDMYVPVTADAATNGRQETEAFKDITFADKAADGSTNLYSRNKYPVYQRAWEKSGVMQIAADKEYAASHYPSGVTVSDVNVSLGSWSHIYNKVDEKYADAADGIFGGFAIKAGNNLLPKDKSNNVLLRLPKDDKSYKYYEYNGTEGKSVTLDKQNADSYVPSSKNSTGHGKLLVAYNNEENHLAKKEQSLGTANESGFYLVANPYTCSISLKKFFAVNTGLQNAVWLVEGSSVRAVSSEDLADKDFAIQPMQSFFVKKASASSGEGSTEGSSTTENTVKFTAQMYVDRLITSGLQMASDYVKTVNITTQNAKGQQSKARIALRAEASADYDSHEDVDLFYDENLKDIPQLYTVAGDQAVAVNAVPSIEWMPVGIIAEKAEAVAVDFKGINKLDAPLYLYDAADQSYTELQDGEAVNVTANEHGRYFLTQTRGTTTAIDRVNAEEQNNLIKVYSPGAGMVVVSALGGETLGRVEVFTLDGKMVHQYQLPDKQRMILRVPTGLYIVKASLASGGKPCSKKIAVR